MDHHNYLIGWPNQFVNWDSGHNHTPAISYSINKSIIEKTDSQTEEHAVLLYMYATIKPYQFDKFVHEY